MIKILTNKFEMETKFLFISVCPVCSSGPEKQHFHRKDKGRLFIWDDCDLECEDCHHSNFITNWRFSCPNHKGFAKIENDDEFGLMDVYAAISQMENIPLKIRMKMKKNFKERLNE